MIRKGKMWHVTLALAAALLALGCGSGNPSSTHQNPPPNSSGQQETPSGTSDFRGVTLRVGTFGGDWLEQEQKFKGVPFEQQTGAKVEYIAGNPSDHAAKLFAARGGTPPMDIITVDAGGLQKLIAGDMLMPLDYSLLPNAEGIAESMKDEYSASFTAFVEGFCYVPSELEKLGVPPLEKPEDLFHPALAGKVSIPTLDVAMGPSMPILLAEANGGGVDNIVPGFEKLRELKVFYYYKSSADLVTKFTSGDVIAAYWQSSRCARLNDSGFPVEFRPVRTPSGKVGVALIDAYVIPKGVEHVEVAHAYINMAISPEKQIEWAIWGTANPTHKQAIEYVRTNEPELWNTSPYTAEDFDNRMYHIDYAKVEKNLTKWLDLWNQYLGG